MSAHFDTYRRESNMDSDTYNELKGLFEAFILSPESLDGAQATRIDEVLYDIDRAVADHGGFMSGGGSHAGWLMNVIVEEFGEHLPEPLREFGSTVPAAASTLAGMASTWLPRSMEQAMSSALSPGTGVANEAEFHGGDERGRMFKRAAAGALSKVSGGKVPLEACVALADMGVETLSSCVDVANGTTTPLEAYSRLTDRAVAVTGAVVRQATRIGAEAVGTAIGAYLGQPTLGRAVGRVVGEAVADRVGAAAQQGTRVLARAIPPAARKLKSETMSMLTRLKKKVWS
jgi:hypothetical protein